MQLWKRMQPTIVSKIGYRTVVSKTFEMPDGNIRHWETLAAEGTQLACIIALTPENKVVIARQFRPGPEKVLEELPGGYVDAGETPEAAVRRELLEETGYTAGEIILLGTSCRDAYSNALFHCFLATNCTPHPDGQQTEGDEYVEVSLVSIDKLLEYGRQGRISDIEALFFAYEKLISLKEGGA